MRDEWEFFILICNLCISVVYQMSTNVCLRLASTEERALMEWTSTLAIAHLAIQETTAKRVSANFCCCIDRVVCYYSCRH